MDYRQGGWITGGWEVSLGMPMTGSVRVTLHAATDVGRVRQNNEDNFLILDLAQDLCWTAAEGAIPPKGWVPLDAGDEGVVLAVSDGMGGALAGEVASYLAVTAVGRLIRYFRQSPSYRSFPFSERLRLALEQANALIFERSQQRREFTGMGATFTAAAFHQGILHLAQVGDSRAYLLRSQRIKQVTKDQSLVEQLVDAGYLTPDQAERHAYRNVILQALGAHPHTVIVVEKIPLCRDDVVLLCTDGLSSKVAASEMAEVVQRASDEAHACAELIRLANERGGEDNITVVVARFSGEGLPPARGEEEPMPVRIERDARLPEVIEPEILDDLSLALLPGVLSDQDEQSGTPSEPENPVPAATDPPVSERVEQEDPPPADTAQGKALSLVLLMILLLLLGGAVASTLWYLKVRGHSRPEPAEPSVLTFEGVPERFGLSARVSVSGWWAAAVPSS
jgi:protein phosphatase